MSETDLEASTEDEGGKESEIPGERGEDEEDENEQRDANDELGKQEDDYEEKEEDEYEGDEEYGEEEEEEGEGRKVVKKAGLIVPDKKDEPQDENEDDVSDEEDIYDEKKEGELKAELRAEKRMSLQVEDDDEEEDEYEDEEEEDYISGPYLSPDSTVPENFLEFYHSFGYDCRRHYNLCIPDPNTVIFASGNYIHFFDIKTKEVTFRRTARGGGIGHIIKNPNPKYPHVAVAEKGLNPLIIIYEWPSMEHIRVLRGGAKRAFACLHYSPDGRFLCSQGCEPDYFLTVWNWKKGRILRQQKAYGQDVFNAMFSDYSLGNLTTGGYGHIKFWKLAKTFTGLKLMGSIGRFGKTEMCDIIGFIALPDEQVVSGCEWGNMLIWNEGLVKAEVCRKAGASCHDGYISQLLYDDKDEEIITIGTDGFIRAWDFKLIEKADLVGDSPKIKIENLYALEVGKGYDKSSLLYIEKQDDNPEKSLWFAQDGNGGIWLVDLDQDHPLAPEKVFRSHAGGVRSVAACPYDTYVASYGDDGRLLFYNYATRRVVLEHKFAAGGGFLVWLDTSVEPTGDVVVCGGADGLVRVAVVALQKREAAGPAARDDDFVCLVQTTKPHTRRVTHMAVREAQALLVTGSEDATVFVYQILPRHDYVSLNPIGFVNVPSAVTHLTWKPNDDRPMILVSCFGGQVVLMEIPDSPQVDTKVSYELKNIQQKEMSFLSVKSQLRRDYILEQDALRRAEKLEMKREKLKAMREENPNLKIDEDLFFEDSESSITLESLYFPEVPNPILFSLYMTNEIIWMSPAGYDAGYMYEYLADMEDPIRCTLIADADDIEIHSYIHDPTGEFLILGMQDGKIRVCRKNPENIADLSDYWVLSMHDNDNGIIPQMCFSYDNKFMFSCGHDGNVFAYVVASEIDTPPIRKPKKSAPWPSDSLEDITDPEMYSLEQLKQKAEYDRKMKLANDHKQEVLEALEKLKEKFASLAQSNKALPLKLRIPYGEFKIDPRIEDDLEDELEDMLALEKRKLAHQAEKSSIALKKLQDYYYNVLETHLVIVRALKNPKLKAYTFRARALGPEFQQAKKFVKEKLDRADKLQRPAGARGTKFAPSTAMKHRLRLGTWLKGIGSVGTNIKMNVKLQRMLLKYYERKRAKELREEQWNRMTQMKPDPQVSHPDDVAAMDQAQRTIGDFKMKTDPNYTVGKEQRVTTDKKYIQLLVTREKVYQIQKEYNDRVLQLRDKKVALINHINELNERLTKRHKELPSSDLKFPQRIPEVSKEEEFPERELTLQEEDILAYYPTPPPSASKRQGQGQGWPAAAARSSVSEDAMQVHGPSLARTQERASGGSRTAQTIASAVLSSYVQAAGGEPPPGYGEDEYAPEEEGDGDGGGDGEFFLTIEDIVQHTLRKHDRRARSDITETRLEADYEILLRDASAPPPPLQTRRSLSGLRRGHPPCPYPRHRFVSDVDVRKFVFRSRRDERDTPWEREMRCRRLCKSRYIQESILKEIDEQVDAFDKEIAEVKEARFAVAVDIKFGELHIIKLHQELIILKEFESVEDALALKVHNTEEDVQGVNNEILDKQMDIEMHKKEIENLDLQVKELGAIFNEKIEENNYADFLRKIYKKKYKPPKEKKDDDESSSSSSEESESSSEEEEDEGSIDSQDMGIIKLDESICPPDLDRALYDMTFDMRNQRHQLEIKEIEEKKSIENLKKEIELKGKSIKILEKTLGAQKSELLAFQREKQHRLNEVMCVVALKASQLRYFEDSSADLQHMGDKLVFSRAMLGRLQARVGELHKETVMQENKFRRYKQHHLRMHIDCKHMRKEIKELKKIIELTLIKKFGNVVNVEDLEDVVLQRLIVQLRTTLHDIKEEFYRLVAMLKGERRKQESVLTGLCRSNSEKMNVLTILTQEKSNLSRLMPLEDKTKKFTVKDVLEYSEELKRLRRVVRNQANQIEVLRGEIRNLSYKGKPPVVVCTPTRLAGELRRLRELAAEQEKLPDVSSDEEDGDADTMFLYMEPRDAEQLVGERASLAEAARWPSVEQVLDDLLRRVPIPSAEELPLERVLDEELERLINKIPPTSAAESILEEFAEMLAQRLASSTDPDDMREALLDVEHDIQGMPSGPADVRHLFRFALGRLKEKEGGVEAAVSARLITYDVLRKCIGYVYGKQFFLATEDALLQVLETLDEETEARVLIDDVINYLEERVRLEEAQARPQVAEVLEDALHDLRSLQAHERAPAVFRAVFRRCREHTGNERDLAAARRVFHDALKRAIGVVAETSYPVSEMGMLPPDQAVTLLLARLPPDSPADTAVELLDEVGILLEAREAAVDDAATQRLVEAVAAATRSDAHAPALRDAPALQRHFDALLKDLARDGPGDKPLFQAQSVLCDVVHRALAFALPALDVHDVVQLLEPAAVVLSLLDKLPSAKDTTQLFDDVVDELSEKNKTELFSEGVQAELPDLIRRLEQVEDKQRNAKNTVADLVHAVKSKKLFKSDAVCVLKLLEDAVRYSIGVHYPELIICDDEEVKNAETYILGFLNYVDAKACVPLFRELAAVLDAWETKTTDPPEVDDVLAKMVEKLRSLPEQSARKKKNISYVFKLIHCQAPTQETALRVLYVLKFCLKAAIRSVVPGVALEDEECHFNPDDTTLAMMHKVPETTYAAQLSAKLQEELQAMLAQERTTKGQQKVFLLVLSALAHLEPEYEAEGPDLHAALQGTLSELKELSVPKQDNIYARIYLNDAVRKCMGLVFPRTDVREAKCSMDKERPTLLMLQKIPYDDDVLVLYDEIRNEMESRYETIEDSIEVQNAIHDVIVELFVEPTDIDHALNIFDDMYMNLRFQDLSRLASLTAKNIFYDAVKKCVENVFPYVDLDDDIVIDKEWPILQMLGQVPFSKQYKELVSKIIDELESMEAAAEDHTKELLEAFRKSLSGKPLDSGNLFLIRPCFMKIKDMHAPVKYFKPFKEAVYAAIKRAIQAAYPKLDLQDNQSAWENEEELLTTALRLPETDDTSVMIDELRERMDVAKSADELSEGLKKILQEIEHHLTVMPMEPGSFEYHTACVFTILRARRGDKKDIAHARSIVYKAMRDTLRLLKEKLEDEAKDDAASDKSDEG